MISEVDIKDWFGDKYVKIAEDIDFISIVPNNLVYVDKRLGMFIGLDKNNAAIVDFCGPILERFPVYYCVDLFTKVV